VQDAGVLLTHICATPSGSEALSDKVTDETSVAPAPQLIKTDPSGGGFTENCNSPPGCRSPPSRSHPRAHRNHFLPPIGRQRNPCAIPGSRPTAKPHFLPAHSAQVTCVTLCPSSQDRPSKSTENSPSHKVAALVGLVIATVGQSGVYGVFETLAKKPPSDPDSPGHSAQYRPLPIPCRNPSSFNRLIYPARPHPRRHIRKRSPGITINRSALPPPQR